MTSAPITDRMPTGVPGLDHLLQGGLVRGNSLLIEGQPGSGKSTLGVRILVEGVRQFQEPGLLVTFEEFPRQVYAEAQGYGIDLQALEQSGLFRVIWTPPARILEAFRGKTDFLERLIDSLKVRRLVIDSITHFKRVVPDEALQREAIALVLNTLKLRGINTIAIKELERADLESIAFEEYLVDASLRVHNERSPGGGENVRTVEVRKTRGQGHVSGRHPFRLHGDGLTIFPHLRPSDLDSMFEALPPRHDARVPIGVSGLDQMLGGGLWHGSLNLVTGYPGTGKSVVAYHFLDAGLAAGETVLVVSLEQTASQMVTQAASLGMRWGRALADGHLRILNAHPIGLCVEELLTSLANELTERKPTRVVFDSVADLRSAVKDSERVRDYVLLLTALLERGGPTSLLLDESRQMGGGGEGDAHDYAHLASGVIQLSMAESDGELRRFVGIRKHNGSDHAKELREFHIDGDGFRVDRKAVGLSGILTGQTRGSLRQVADEALPALEEATAFVREASDTPGLPDALCESLRKAHVQLGLLDVLLKEHFGITDFQSLVEEWTKDGPPPASDKAA